MALGGGIFTDQNKVLPGAYMNFVSNGVNNPTLAERGVGVIITDEIGWGSQIIELTTETVQTSSLKLIGREYTESEKNGNQVNWVMPAVRDFFKNGSKLYLCRSDSSLMYASNTFGSAKYSGILGNEIKTVIYKNTDDATKYDVLTYFRENLVDTQTVATAKELIDNDYVHWNIGATLTATAGLSMTGGKNGTCNGNTIQNLLSDLESYTFNTIGVCQDEESYDALLVAYVKRMREEVGKKIVAIVKKGECNYEAVVCQHNDVDEDSYYSTAWLIGAYAGCAINESLTNKKYDGEFTMGDTDKSQTQLVDLMKRGYFVFHKVGDDVRVLSDINSFTTITPTKGEVFKENQTVRICDQIAIDTATIFNDIYLGKVPNDNAGRSSLWGDLVKLHEKYQNMRAIEDFNAKDIYVGEGETKRAVVVSEAVKPINAMEQLYMTITVN